MKVWVVFSYAVLSCLCTREDRKGILSNMNWNVNYFVKKEEILRKQIIFLLTNEYLFRFSSLQIYFTWIIFNGFSKYQYFFEENIEIFGLFLDQFSCYWEKCFWKSYKKCSEKHSIDFIRRLNYQVLKVKPSNVFYRSSGKPTQYRGDQCLRNKSKD